MNMEPTHYGTKTNIPTQRNTATVSGLIKRKKTVIKDQYELHIGPLPNICKQTDNIVNCHT